MAALTTLSLLLYFVALDLLIGGSVVALHARLRATPPHRALAARLARTLPLAAGATAVLGAASLVLLRARFGDFAAGSTLPSSVADRTLTPRMLHVLLAAVAVTGVFLAQAALRLRSADPAFGSWLARHGIAWTVFATLANLLVGGWWFVRLPYDTLIRFTGANAPDMLTFVVAIVSALLALGCAAMSAAVADPRRYLHAATAGFAITLAAMVRMREALRPLSAQATPPWPSLAAVVLLTAIGVLLLAWTWRRFLRTPLVRQPS